MRFFLKKLFSYKFNSQKLLTKFLKNLGENYNVNSSFAKQDKDGNYVLNFGQDSAKENFLEIYPGSNATLRIYSPQKPYFDGSWKVPEMQSAASSQ